MRRDLVVIGASSGGIQAASAILAGLPPDLPAAVFVVIHLPADYPSMLPKILGGVSPLGALHPRDRMKFRYGRIYVAPPDRHLIVERDRIRLVRSPAENLHRPAIDPLFRSAAFYHRTRVVGVLLTGSDSDGTAGLFSIRMRGGTTLVQDPREAHSPVMPWNALRHVRIDHVLGLDEMAPLLVRLTNDRNGEKSKGRASHGR